MLTTPVIQNLEDYFARSSYLFYLVIDKAGLINHANPHFRKYFSNITDDFTDCPQEIVFNKDAEKIKSIIDLCLNNPGRMFPTDTRISSFNNSVCLVKWEFSACFNEMNNGCVQAVGMIAGVPDVSLSESEKQTELFYRNLISFSLDGIILTDTQGGITYSGSSVEKISGYTSDQLHGHSLFEFVHPDDIAAATEAFAKELNHQTDIDYLMLRLKHADGHWIWCTVRGHNLLDNPAVNSMVIYFADDSKRKTTEDKLRQSEKEFRSLIQNLQQGVIVQNEKAEVLIFNKAALDMLGLKEDQLVAKTFLDFHWNVVHDDGSPFTAPDYPVFMAIETKKPVKDVVMGVCKHNSTDRVWLLVSAEPVLDNENNLINVICSFSDITVQRRLSQELIEQEIQKQKQLTQATIDGQEKERQEIGKELHDNINQHLNTTRLYLEVAREKATGEVLEMINLSHNSLTSIVNEIRNLSQSLVPPTLGDLGLVESVIELSDSLKRAYPFNIDFLYRHFNEEGLPDNLKLMLFRITQEQINNVVRHSQANSIQIKLQSDAENVILVIADNGIGFNRHTYRKGLGFSNISNRAALFNGKVEIDAAPGYGCALTVIVPLETNH